MTKRCCISGVRSVFPHLLDTKVYNKCYIYNKCCTKKSNKMQYSLNSTTISRYYAGLFYKIADTKDKIKAMAVRKTLKSAYQIEEKKPQKWGVSSADYNTQRWRDYKKRYIQYRLSLGQTTCDICKKDFGFKSRMVKGKMIKYLEREIDHVKPISLGGEMYQYDNLQQLCHVCHTRKTSKEIKERQ